MTFTFPRSFLCLDLKYDGILDAMLKQGAHTERCSEQRGGSNLYSRSRRRLALQPFRRFNILPKGSPPTPPLAPFSAASAPCSARDSAAEPPSSSEKAPLGIGSPHRPPSSASDQTNPLIS